MGLGPPALDEERAGLAGVARRHGSPALPVIAVCPWPDTAPLCSYRSETATLCSQPLAPDNMFTPVLQTGKERICPRP